jgi:hypothetical protein
VGVGRDKVSGCLLEKTRKAKERRSRRRADMRKKKI